jgi:hypothetical protein
MALWLRPGQPNKHVVIPRDFQQALDKLHDMLDGNHLEFIGYLGGPRVVCDEDYVAHTLEEPHYQFNYAATVLAESVMPGVDMSLNGIYGPAVYLTAKEARRLE